MPNSSRWRVQPQEAEQRESQAQEADAQFAHAVDIVVDLGTFQQTLDLIHIFLRRTVALKAPRLPIHLLVCTANLFVSTE